MAVPVGQGLIVDEVRFVENGAGTYVGTINVPAGATIYDVFISAEALWTAATSAALIVGDAADDDFFFPSIDLKATDLLATESVSFDLQGGKAGAIFGTATHQVKAYSAVARVIKAKVVSVGAGTGGRTRVAVLYFRPTGTVTVSQ